MEQAQRRKINLTNLSIDVRFLVIFFPRYADSSASAIVTNVNIVPKESFSHKFTTSNFTETVLVSSDAAFGDRDSKSTNSATSSMPNVKKRKIDVKSSTPDDINK